jgi:hypothetical protein
MHARRRSPANAVTFLVEGYWPEATLESFAGATARLDASLDGLRSHSHGSVLRTVAATLVPADEAAYWVVRAPSADLVATACAMAGVRVERIIEALQLRAERAGEDTGSGDRPAASGQDPKRR